VPDETTDKSSAADVAKASVGETADSVPSAGVAASKKTPCRNALFPLGVNYYPVDAAARGQDDWYAGDIAEDLAAFAEAHMTLVRVFISWKAYEPQVGRYSDSAEERLLSIAEVAREHGLRLVICFFADDRLSGLLDVPWGGKRDPRFDAYLIQREVALVQRIVNRFRAEESVFAWDLANEAFCSGFSSAEHMSEWAEGLRDAIREIDRKRPIMLSVDPETLFRHTGVDARSALAECEIAVSHATAPYRAYAAEGPLLSGPPTYLESFLLHSTTGSAPVLLDDVGVHSLGNSLAEEAAAIRCSLYSGLMNRADGVLLRRWRDLDTERREPYFRDPLEVLVGVRDTLGVAKPAMAELKSFSRVAACLDLRRYTLTQERTAVLVPAERYEPLPSLAGLFDPRACLEAYVSAKEAHIPVTVVHEEDPYDSLSVIVVPSAFSLAEETWERLGEWVQGGGSLILSYGGGDADPAVRGLFGVEFLGDGGPRQRATCRVAQPDVLGSLVSFDTRLDLNAFALLGQGGATVVATDAKGSPILTLHQYGQGRAVFVAAPLERALAQGDPWAADPSVKSLLWTVYGAVAGAAGCGAPLVCDTPAVEIALFSGADDDILLLLNHSPEKVVAGLGLERKVATIVDVRGGSPAPVGDSSFGVPIAESGVAALRLTYG